MIQLFSSALLCTLCLGFGIPLLIAGKLLSGGVMLFCAGSMAVVVIEQCVEKWK